MGSNIVFFQEKEATLQGFIEALIVAEDQKISKKMFKKI